MGKNILKFALNFVLLCVKTLKPWKLWNNQSKRSPCIIDDNESMMTKTEEEARTLKIVSCHCMLLPALVGACTKKIELSSLNYLLRILHQRTRRVRARNKEGRGTTLNLPNKKFGSNLTRNSAQIKQEIRLRSDKKSGVSLLKCAPPI